MIYAGIGSREIQKDVKKELIEIGAILAKNGYILRSGGANGADSAFERGCDLLNGNKEIYLPWKNFNDNLSPLYLPHHIPDNLESIAKSIYLSWENASIGTKKLHARNVQQILGKDANSPCDFVVCWTNRPDNQFGGTQFGIKLAISRNIKVYNLFKENEKQEFYDKIIKSL